MAAGDSYKPEYIDRKAVLDLLSFFADCYSGEDVGRTIEYARNRIRDVLPPASVVPQETDGMRLCHEFYVCPCGVSLWRARGRSGMKECCKCGRRIEWAGEPVTDNDEIE